VAAHAVVAGVGPDAPVVANEHGGRQSLAPYRHDQTPLADLAVARLLHEGSLKYDDPHGDNWRKVSPLEHFNHLMTHAKAWAAGDGQDEHEVHLACRAMMFLQVILERRAAEGVPEGRAAA
jgi:hypothetical protein